LTPAAFQILLALAGGEQPGYEIMVEIARESGGVLRLGPTTLYRTVRTPLKMGLIEETEEPPDPDLDDQRQRYYRLTPAGRQAAMAETERLRRLVAVADTKLYPILSSEVLEFLADVLAHWPVPYEELDLPTQFGTTHIIVSGPNSGKPVLLLHGQDSCAISWIYNVVDLSQAFRIFALDTIGDMGKSKPIHLPNSREDYARWMLDVFDQLKIEKADLVGLSYGGFLATNFALAFPERVNRIVLLSPGIPNFAPPTLQWANYGMPMMLLPSRFTVRRFINGASMKGYSKEDPVHEQMIVGIMNMR
jgi:DNA-binding PadR family transcriptional regulator